MHYGLEPAYIGPGAGFAFLGSFLSLAPGVLAALASMRVWPLRPLWTLLRRRRGPVKKATFLGFDGLDPAMTKRLMSEGKMRHFARLRASVAMRGCEWLSRAFARGVVDICGRRGDAQEERTVLHDVGGYRVVAPSSGVGYAPGTNTDARISFHCMDAAEGTGVLFMTAGSGRGTLRQEIPRYGLFRNATEHRCRRGPERGRASGHCDRKRAA